MLFKASAPGSLMLLGEHAVLHGGAALVLAVNYRMHVILSPRKDRKIKIKSVMGSFECDISEIRIESPFEFMLTVFKKYQTQFPIGFDIEAHSEFSHQIGFASSAAVTVATLRAIHAWLALSFSEEELILEARDIVRQVQGVGSGADVAACVLGGMVAFRAEPFSAEKIEFDYPITVVYSGGKTKTAEVIRYVNDQFKENKAAYDKILHGISECADAGILASRMNDHVELGNVMNQQQILMSDLKVNTKQLQSVIDIIKSDSNILGAKISGSGLGDCAIGLGEAGELALPLPITRYICKIDQRGVHLE